MNTQKPVQKLKIWTFILVAFLLSACDSGGELKNATLKEAKQPEFLYISDASALDYLNDYRRGSGLFALKFNENLKIASQNHADYSVEHEFMGHDESAGMAKFTGATPGERAKFAGYNSTHVLENIAYKGDFKASIDGLFAAIYHRFAFLNLSINEVGYANASSDKFSAYVFLMGNSLIDGFCKKGASDTGAGRFYTNVCANKNIHIQDSRYGGFMKSSKPYVKFPDALPVLPYFSGEVPDPFPECKITANPVSIEFNESARDIKLKNFDIYKDGEKLTNLKIIDRTSDINGKFSAFQFAVFSRDVFEFNSEYSAVFSYIQENQTKEIKWSFKTRSLKFPYFDASDGDVLALDADKTYEIFFRPKDCNDLLTNYSYNASRLLKPTIAQSGTNTLSVSLKGMAGDVLTIKTNGEKSVKLVLKTSSPEIERERRNYIIKASIMIAGVIIVFFLIGLKYRG